ncbi:hypothetical protein BH23GEM6_BH23GEM6_23590 [soil metagenome]
MKIWMVRAVRTGMFALLTLALIGTGAGAQAAPATPAGLHAGHDAAPVAHALRISDPIRVDGRLDEEVWSRATPVTEFIQFDPNEGQPASEGTEVRFLFDDDAIYIGARLYDSHPVTTRLARRDQWAVSDWLTVIFDSHHDHRTAYGFEVNPSGVRRDQSRTASGSEDDSWDPVWQVATSIDEEGWTAEMRIPFSQLRFNAGPRQTWGLQIERQIARRNEFSVFSFTPRSQPGGIPRFGHLEGLSQLRTGKRLEALPYAVARGESVDRSGNPFRENREAGLSGGLDLKYRLTSDLTVDATFNPDFGQVEVDPAEVNLSAIETFFQERRPFFVEGAEIFRFGSGGGNNVFYSRRIGRSPQLPTPGVADVPDAARILGAAKVSGRTSSGWSVGLLNASTERVQARFMDVSGNPALTNVEPFTNYMVSRLRRDYRAGQTDVGAMFTAVNRDLQDELAQQRLHSAAYTGGVDFRHQWAERSWTLNGFVSGSHVQGSEAAMLRTQRFPWRYWQRPDADHLEIRPDATSLTGVSAETSLAFRRGRHWRASGTVGTISPGYELNDLGFQFRGDRIDTSLGGMYSETRPGQIFRQYNINSNVRQEWNYAGDLVQRSIFVSGSGQRKNYWNHLLNVGATLPSMDDRLTRGGPIAERPWNLRVFTGTGTDFRKPVSAFVGIFSSWGEGGSWSQQLFSEFEAKPSPTWSVSMGPSLNRSYSLAQFRGSVADATATGTFGRRYLFSEIHQTALSLNTRVNVTFTPDLSLQLFAQPFIASGDFGPVAELAAPRSYRFLVYGRDRGEVEATERGVRVFPDGRGGAAAPFEVGNGDFNVRSLRGNAVVRWEWRPGSTLFVAWQQMRSDFEGVGDFAFGRDQRALWGARPDNVLVVKLNYWLNP